MKKLLIAAALLGVAGTSSAFLNTSQPNGDVTGTSIIRSVIGAAPNPGDYVDARTPGVRNSDAGIVLIYKLGSNLVVELNSSGFTAASENLSGLGTIDPRGNLVITGDGLTQLAQNVGVNPGDITVKKLTIKKAGL